MVGKRKTFSWGRTPKSVTVYIASKNGRIIGRLTRKHIIFYEGPSKKRGRLRDGRPVSYRNGKWIYKID